jgi:N-acetylglucosaminyldiphosphoundecaprenol N-acetyl-beta-D-mannosaminyltransferase
MISVPTSKGSFDHCTILGVQVTPITVPELHDHLAAYIQQNKKSLVLNVNVNCLNLSYHQPWLRDYLNKADIVFCDGAGVMLGAHILGYSIPERITYADWMWRLAEFAQHQSFTFYFLGARPGIVEQAVTRLQQRFPRLNIVGTHHGYFDHTPGSPENEAVIEKINAFKPNILVLGFGMPAQEKWLVENWHYLDVNIALTGGAVFDYLSGELQRSPKWMNENGFEWLGRLLIEPRRLWQRYLIGNPLFLWRVLKQRWGFLSFPD